MPDGSVALLMDTRIRSRDRQHPGRPPVAYIPARSSAQSPCKDQIARGVRVLEPASEQAPTFGVRTQEAGLLVSCAGRRSRDRCSEAARASRTPEELAMRLAQLLNTRRTGSKTGFPRPPFPGHLGYTPFPWYTPGTLPVYTTWEGWGVHHLPVYTCYTLHCLALLCGYTLVCRLLAGDVLGSVRGFGAGSRFVVFLGAQLCRFNGKMCARSPARPCENNRMIG